MTVYRLSFRPTAHEWNPVRGGSPLKLWAAAVWRALGGPGMGLADLPLYGEAAAPARTGFYPCVLAGRAVIYSNGPATIWYYAPAGRYDALRWVL